LFFEPVSKLAAGPRALSRTAWATTYVRLAASERYNTDERLAFHSFFRDSTDRSGIKRSGSARSSFFAGFFDGADRPRRLLWQRREQSFVFFHTDQHSWRERSRPGPVWHAGARYVSRAGVSSTRFRADQRYFVWPSRKKRAWHRRIPRRILQPIQHCQFRIALEHRPGDGIWIDQPYGRDITPNSVLAQAHLL